MNQYDFDSIRPDSMSFKFEKLIIWKRAMEFAEDIYRLTRDLPEEEKFNLTGQSLRASDSIALNIAEGSIGHSNPEFRRYVGIAIRSLAEMVTCLYKARLRQYIDQGKFEYHYSQAFNLMNMIIGFRDQLK